MFRVLSCLGGEHDLRLVALAGAICFLASVTAINLFHRGKAASGGSGSGRSGATGGQNSSIGNGPGVGQTSSSQTPNGNSAGRGASGSAPVAGGQAVGSSGSSQGRPSAASPAAAAASTRSAAPARSIAGPVVPTAQPIIPNVLLVAPPSHSSSGEWLPPTLLPVTEVTGTLAHLSVRALPRPPIGAPDRTSNVALGPCRTSIAAAARRLGAIDVTVSDAGPANRLPRGRLVAPIYARVTYARGGAKQVRQARVACHLDEDAKVIALR